MGVGTRLWVEPPHPGQPPQHLPSKVPPAPRNLNPEPCPPPPPPSQTHATQKAPPLAASPLNQAAAHRRFRHTPVDMGRG